MRADRIKANVDAVAEQFNRSGGPPAKVGRWVAQNVGGKLFLHNPEKMGTLPNAGGPEGAVSDRS